jgi:uncharacterized protein (DUF58 family)
MNLNSLLSLSSRQGQSEALQQQIRKLRLTARRIIHTFGEGTFRTLFHGRGIEFATLREYVPGDDIRQIEWNTTARRGTPYVKTFVEERDLSILLAVDLSASMEIKKQIVLRLAALITSLADYQEDRIGALGFTEEVEFFLPPSKNHAQPDRILHLLHQTHHRRKTSISQALLFLKRVLKKHTILFLVSDFLDQNFESNLLATAKKHELIGLYIHDPLERHLPGPSVIDGLDPESGKQLLLDAYDSKTRRNYEDFFLQQKQLVTRIFGGAHADLLILPATEKADVHLIRFLQRRQTSRNPLQISL